MRHSSALVSLLAILMCSGAAWAQGQQAPPSGATLPNGSPQAGAAGGAQPEVLSYALGFNIGGNMKSNEVKVDLASLMAGIQDGMGGAQPKCSEGDMIAALEQFQKQLQQKAQAAMGQMAAKGKANQAAADAFLAKNKTQPGVQTTPSGLQYMVVQQGNGPSPTLNDTVRCHYRGTLMDGTEFDSSIGGEPVEFPVDRVIPGWTEALQKMRVGDKWQLFVPPNLAYGMDPPGPPLEANSLLIFEIELLGIEQQ
jgi:FKBP-type peptidyl-prolyl cis-trans isomerase FklB